jgi:hypothetical protein
MWLNMGSLSLVDERFGRGVSGQPAGDGADLGLVEIDMRAGGKEALHGISGKREWRRNLDRMAAPHIILPETSPAGR